MMELRETWELVGGRMIAGGDAAEIDVWLAERLEKRRPDASGWRALYRDRRTGDFWELDYPDSHLAGGGPRLLRRLHITAEDQWVSA
jgi:hypothetical protein